MAVLSLRFPGQGPGRDGGNWATWHGPGVAMQWDEIDISNQPLDYQASPEMPVVRDLLGTEYECKLRVTDPSGKVHRGTGHLELITFGRHKRYGFGDDYPPGGGSGGGSGGSGTFRDLIDANDYGHLPRKRQLHRPQALAGVLRTAGLPGRRRVRGKRQRRVSTRAWACRPRTREPCS